MKALGVSILDWTPWFLFLILGAGRNLMRKNIQPFHRDNMPASNREQHTQCASSGLLKQANECNSTRQCHSLFPLHLFGAQLSQMRAELTFICIYCHLKITSMHHAWKSIWTEPGNQCQGKLWQQVMLLGVPSCQDPQLLLEVLEGTSKWLTLACVFLMFWLSSAWYSTFWGQGRKKA